MDALALLCNLHGDGPATLAGLRALGVHELDDLGGLEEGTLVGILGGTPTAAARFRREARLLHERLEGPLTDSSREAPVVEQPVAEPAVDQASEQAPSEAATEPEPERGLVPRPPAAPTAPVATAPTDQPPTDQDPVVHAVLGLWNHLDRAPRPEAGVRTLAESDLEGLRPEQVVLLAQAGVRTLDELVACDPLTVSGEVEIPFTHLSHLRFLARKRLREAGAPPPMELAGEVAGEESGGPFA